jgi:hypothetical protein
VVEGFADGSVADVEFLIELLLGEFRSDLKQLPSGPRIMA